MRDREEDLPSYDSLPKWLQHLVRCRSEARSQEPPPGLPHGCRFQGFGPSSTTLPGHRQGAGWEVELPGWKPISIWDPGAFRASTLATRPPHHAPNCVSYKKPALLGLFWLCFKSKTIVSFTWWTWSMKLRILLVGNDWSHHQKHCFYSMHFIVLPAQVGIVHVFLFLFPSVRPPEVSL